MNDQSWNSNEIYREIYGSNSPDVGDTLATMLNINIQNRYGENGQRELEMVSPRCFDPITDRLTACVLPPQRIYDSKSINRVHSIPELRDLIYNELSNKDKFMMSYAMHSCVHSEYACEDCIPLIPGCCLSMIFYRDDRLSILTLDGDDFPKNLLTYGMRLRSDFMDLKASLNNSRLHIYGEYSYPDSNYEFPVVKDYVDKICQFCNKQTEFDDDIILVGLTRCSSCLSHDISCQFSDIVDYVGILPSPSSDLDKKIIRNGTLISTLISDPSFIEPIMRTKFVIKNCEARKWLRQESIIKGADEANASKEDYYYEVEATIEYNDMTMSKYGSNRLEETYRTRALSYQGLCSLRHDFVATQFRGSTDRSLRTLGIQMNLTPDFITESPKVVLELATNAGGQPKSMEASYISKRIAYEDILTINEVSYLILVVSPYNIMTNMPLSSGESQEYVLRCKVGIAIENLVESILNLPLTGTEDEIKGQSSIRGQFLKFNESLILPTNQHMNGDIVRVLNNESSEESSHAEKIIHETLIQGLKGDSCHYDEKALDKYMEHFTEDNTRKKDKLVTIFPMIVAMPQPLLSRGSWSDLGSNVNCPSSLFTLFKNISFLENISREHLSKTGWLIRSRMSALETEDKFKKYKYNYGTSYSHSIHDIRKSSVVKPLFLEEQELELALQGVQAKALSNNEELRRKELDSKWSFHPSTNTQDIEEFWNRTENMITNENWRKAVHDDPVSTFIMNEKIRNPLNLKDIPDSVEMFALLSQLEVVQLGELITDICIEISAEYKTPTKPGEWIMKALRRFKVVIAMVCTGTHVFFSLCFDKLYCKSIDTGHIGARSYETEHYLITDVVSITEPYLEHFLKSGPYILMISAHLLHSFEVPFTTGDWLMNSEYFQTLNYLVLTFLNNKIDHEEMLTNLRFLYMKLLQEVGGNIYDYVDRLPLILRSRLSVFSLKRIIKIMEFYGKHRITRRKMTDMSGVEWSHKNLRTIYHSGFVKIDQLIDSFYYSYVVTKNKSAMGDHTFQIFNKVFKEQNEAHKKLILTDTKIWGLLDKPEKHRWDYALERQAIKACFRHLEDKHGPSFLKSMHKSIYNTIHHLKFSNISTLKASSKDYTDGQKLPTWSDGLTRDEYLKEFKKLNPNLNGKRPRVITTLNMLLQDYMNDTEDHQPSVLTVTLWSMKKLLKRGFILSDLFIKDQHNGVREIHVLEILARMIQYLTEQIAKKICQYFDNDSVCSPNCKKKFYFDHEKESEAVLNNHVTLGKSADASKWCQRNHVSQFFFDMCYFTPPEMHQFLYCVFYLWTKKRIAVDPHLLDNLDRNRDAFSTNPDYIKMRDAFHRGENPFLERRGTFMEIGFGMFQGILHDASCLKHNIVQTHWAVLTKSFYDIILKTPSVITHIQGSDDSGALISIPSHNPGMLLLTIGLLWWKEEMAKYSSIWTSVPKTSVGTLSLIEYNSDWYFSGRNIKPTFRWNSACLSTTLVERLPSRVEVFYNSLTQSLETGSSTLLCAVTQMCQASLHYKLMGLGSNLLTSDTFNELQRTKNVSLGYFPLELDHIAGITGFDFQLYLLAKQGIQVSNWEIEALSETATIEYDSKIDKSLRESLRSFCIRFSNIKHYESVVKDTGLPKLESLLNKVKNNPELLYLSLNTWDQEELKMVLALDNPGVKASLSSYQPTARMMASSTYLINTPCVTGKTYGGQRIKKSLLTWLKEQSTPKKLCSEVLGSKSTDVWFCNQEQYDSFEGYLKALHDSLSYQRVSMKRSNKVDVLVWGKKTDVMIPLMDVVRRKWFGVKTIHCSQTVFDLIWTSTTIRYPFLCESYKETLDKLGFEDISLFRFLQSISDKTRTVHLQDSTTRTSSLWNTATRIFWPKTKVRTHYDPYDTELKTLKHSIHCLLSYFYKKNYSLSKVKELIRQSKALSHPFHLSTASEIKLRVFRAVLEGANKLDILNAIEQSKIGVVGYFQKRQSRDSKGYTGSGEWIGQIGGVDTMISMIDKEVIYVKIARLTDISAQARSIKMLLRDFQLSFKIDPLPSHNNLYFDSTGNIIRSSSKPSGSCPLIVDRNLSLGVKDKILDQEWFIDNEGDTLKLCFSGTSKHNNYLKYTILSETFGSHTWDPLLPCPNMEDENFMNWCKGVPCRPITMLSQLFYPSETQDVKILKIHLDNRNYMRPDSNYDMIKFNQIVRQFLKRKLRGQNFSDLKYEYLSNTVRVPGSSQPLLISQEKIEETKLRYKSYLEKFNLDSSVLDALIDKWDIEDKKNLLEKGTESFISMEEADSSEETHSVYSKDEWNIEDDALYEIKDMFSTQDRDITQLQSWQDETYRSNTGQVEVFMSSFLDLLKDMEGSNEIFQNLKEGKLNSTRRLTGPGGALLYVTMGYGDYHSQALDPIHTLIDTESVSDFLSASAARGEFQRDPVKLDVEIRQIQQILPTLSGPLLSTMQRRLNRLESEKNWLSSINTTMTASTELHLFNKNEFLISLYDVVVSRELYINPVSHPSPMTNVEFMLSYASDKIKNSYDVGIISASEWEDMKTALWIPTLHPSCIKALSFLFESNIVILIDGTEVFNYSRSYFFKEFTMTIDTDKVNDGQVEEPIIEI